MWPLPLAIVLGRQEQLQRIGAAERDWFRERRLLAESEGEKVLLASAIRSPWAFGGCCVLLLASPARLLCDNREAAVVEAPSRRGLSNTCCEEQERGRN